MTNWSVLRRQAFLSWNNGSAWILHRRNSVQESYFSHRLFASIARQNILVTKLRETGRASVLCWFVPDTFISNQTISSAPISNVSIRRFSSRRSKKTDSKGQLSNERLVAFLVKNSGKSAAELQVRIVVEEIQKKASGDGVDQQRNVEVVSLTEAIKRSTELGLDLIEIDARQEIPVVQIESLKAYEYKQTKKTKANMSNALPDKEFQFRATIAENDLQRKVDKMVDYLEKGHKCSIRVFTRAKMRQQYPTTAVDMVDRIMERVGNAGEIISKVEVDPEGRTAFCRLEQPPKQKRN